MGDFLELVAGFSQQLIGLGAALFGSGLLPQIAQDAPEFRARLRMV